MNRVVTLVVGVLILLAPLLWIAWSLAAASAAAEAIRVQSETLASLRLRLAALATDPDAGGALADAARIFLPGETAAIAGAALQRIVTDTVEQVGGRLEESEIARSEQSEDDPGRLTLRVSFEADIVGLQNILFKLETGVPILILDSLTVESGEAFGSANAEQPLLRVVAWVGGYWQVQP
jgi:hypothetical protein